MTPFELATAMDVLGWSNRGLSARCVVDESTIRRWLQGERPVPDHVAAWLRKVSAPLKRYPRPADLPARSRASAGLSRIP